MSRARGKEERKEALRLPSGYTGSGVERAGAVELPHSTVRCRGWRAPTVAWQAAHDTAHDTGHSEEEAARDGGHGRGTPELSSAGGGSARGEVILARSAELLLTELFSSLSGALPPPSP